MLAYIRFAKLIGDQGTFPGISPSNSQKQVVDLYTCSRTFHLAWKSHKYWFVKQDSIGLYVLRPDKFRPLI